MKKKSLVNILEVIDLDDSDVEDVDNSTEIEEDVEDMPEHSESSESENDASQAATNNARFLWKKLTLLFNNVYLMKSLQLHTMNSSLKIILTYLSPPKC